MKDFNYGGFTLEQYNEVEYDGDNSKNFHFIHGPGLVRSHFQDWTPYAWMTFADFQIVVWFYTVTGRFPHRGDIDSCGPLHSEDLKGIMEAVL